MVSLPVGWCPGRDAVVKDGRKGPLQNALTSFVDPAEVQPKYLLLGPDPTVRRGVHQGMNEATRLGFRAREDGDACHAGGPRRARFGPPDLTGAWPLLQLPEMSLAYDPPCPRSCTYWSSWQNSGNISSRFSH